MSVVQAKKPDAVVHCAAIVGVTNSLASPIGTLRINVEGSLNVFEAMRLLGVRRTINLSSEETYGVFERARIDETHPNRPLKPYGISKYAVERLACDYASTYGLEIIHVRTCWVYGPGLPRPRVPKILVDAAVAGRKLHLPSGGDFRVDHVYIDDCVDGIVKALDKPKHRYDVYHIATGEAPSLSEIVDIVHGWCPEPTSPSDRALTTLSMAPKHCARAHWTSPVRATSSATSRAIRSDRGSPPTSTRRGRAAVEYLCCGVACRRLPVTQRRQLLYAQENVAIRLLRDDLKHRWTPAVDLLQHRWDGVKRNRPHSDRVVTIGVLAGIG